jgi:hypothetical protein
MGEMPDGISGFSLSKEKNQKKLFPASATDRVDRARESWGYY